MAKPVRDKQMVKPSGKEIIRTPHGVTLKELTTHVDDRGEVCELYDVRWKWNSNPFVFSYIYLAQ